MKNTVINLKFIKIKKIILSISILGMSFGMQAQTNVAIGTGGTTTAPDFHYYQGGVGIGIVPHNYTDHELVIHDDVSATMMFQSNLGVSNILFVDDDGYSNMIRSQPFKLSFGRGLDWTHHTGGSFTSHMTIDKNSGNVGIGTDDSKGFKLGVNGKIAALEVKVAAYTNWADFVFEKEYDLPTLTEVENHIKQNGHLQNIPSAKEVEKNGFFLGEMNAKLLQKIEELTLYTIDQEKQLKAQNAKIEKLEDENNDIKILAAKLLELQLEIKKLKK